jgi:putative DNA primase/helicase
MLKEERACSRPIDDQLGKYVVLNEHYRTAAVLWVPMDWVHNEIATHSPFLDVVSVDEGSGKTELLGILALLTQRPRQGAEFMGPNIYRTVHRGQPTLILDEADDVFQRRPDLKHVINTSWMRGPKIPRQVRIAGEWQTYWFNVFCPKIISHVLLPGKPLPRAIASRGICIRMWPKRRDEHVEEFLHRDDNEFATLRRKLLRFANDHAKAIAEINPVFPSGFNNRTQANWKLLLAIAKLAGGDWPERARKAAEYIAGRTEGSQGAGLFAAFHAMCVARLKGGATEIVFPSEQVVKFLRDFDPYWLMDYRGSDGHPGEITKSKLAALLRNYEILPEQTHPTKRSSLSRRRYTIFETGKWNERWIDMFARFCPGLPDIQTLVIKPDRSDGKKPK